MAWDFKQSSEFVANRFKTDVTRLGICTKLGMIFIQGKKLVDLPGVEGSGESRVHFVR